MDKIPKLIHLTYKEKKIPEIYVPYFKKIQELHPEWQVTLYDDNDCLEIIARNFPSLLSLYQAYKLPVQKADIFRIVVVYLFGGFYMDLDINCFKKLDSLCNYQLVLGEEKTLSEADCSRLQLKHSQRIGNYMFGSEAGHPFWMELLKAAILKAANPVLDENDVLEITGPGLLTNVYHELKERYQDITLIRNIDRMCLRKCTEVAACHFGDYAAHLHLGSWRWAHKGIGRVAIVSGNTHTGFKEIASELVDRLSTTYTIAKGECLIVETYPSSESSYDGLTGIFREIKDVGKVVADTRRISGAKVLVCGIPTLHERNISGHNKNIVFTTFESDQLPADWVRSINQYQYCLVPHSEIKKVFENSGVSSPIYVIHQGFRRFKRNWHRKPPSQTFNVGFLGIPVNRKNLQKLYNACKHLQSTTIPNIKLVVHVAAFYNWLDQKPFQKMQEDGMIIWSEGKYDTDQMSAWYNNLSCYAFPSSGEGWSYTPRESMYMRIPTILSDIPLHRELIDTGFCKTIKHSGKEPANFNGKYHGEWHKIEVDEIESAIADVYSHYDHYLTLAEKGGEWIEDKWKNEDIRQQLLNFITSI